jgi:hypothetical protein
MCCNAVSILYTTYYCSYNILTRINIYECVNNNVQCTLLRQCDLPIGDKFHSHFILLIYLLLFDNIMI